MVKVSGFCCWSTLKKWKQASEMGMQLAGSCGGSGGDGGGVGVESSTWGSGVVDIRGAVRRACTAGLSRPRSSS